MKRSYVVLSLTPLLVLLTFAAASCGAGKSGGDSKKPVSTYDPNGDEADGGSSASSTTDLDAAPPQLDGAFDPLRQIENTGQALQVLITAYDVQMDEGELGKVEGSTPPMKAFAADVVEGGKAGKARIRQVAANKHVRPESSMLNDQMKFESAASMNHLRNSFRNMFNANWCSRQSESASALIRLIDQDLEPIMQDDDTLKEALATTREDAEKRKARAEAVRSGLGDVGNSDGMFPEQEDPEPVPQPQEPEPEPAAEGDAG